VTGSAFTGNAGSGINSGATQGEDFLTVSRSTFTRNTATQGGAIDLDSFASGSLTATRDTFTRNTATVGGGAIYNFDFAAVTSSTFTGNSAPVGGGMENEWTLTWAVPRSARTRPGRAGACTTTTTSR
jgi:hypothetical protein